jgi:hypothetical protein
LFPGNADEAHKPLEGSSLEPALSAAGREVALPNIADLRFIAIPEQCQCSVGTVVRKDGEDQFTEIHARWYVTNASEPRMPVLLLKARILEPSIGGLTFCQINIERSVRARLSNVYPPLATGRAPAGRVYRHGSIRDRAPYASFTVPPLARQGCRDGAVCRAGVRGTERRKRLCAACNPQRLFSVRPEVLGDARATGTGSARSGPLFLGLFTCVETAQAFIRSAGNGCRFPLPRLPISHASWCSSDRMIGMRLIKRTN